MISLLITVALVAAIVGAAFGAWLCRRFMTVQLLEMKAFADEWKQTAKERQAVIDRMRQDGYTIQRSASVKEAPDVETEGLARAESQMIGRRDDQAFIARAKADIMKKNPNISDREALAEAVRLRKEILMEDPPT